jgi:RNA polymerase sigma-70 factor (ECF subfamily)
MFGSGVDRAFARFRASGDPAALARVFDATAPTLLRLARHLASSEAAAEDLLQATFVTVIESREQHDGERAALPWLTGILANHARAARRRAKRTLSGERLPQPVSTDPFEAVVGAEVSTTLARVIEALPELYRSVVRLHVEHGLTPSEISTALSRPPATVRSQLARGLEHVRRSLAIGVGASVALSLVGARGIAQIRQSVLAKVAPPSGVATGASLASLVSIMTGKAVWVGVVAIAVLGWWFVGGDAPVVPQSTAVSPTAKAESSTPLQRADVTATRAPDDDRRTAGRATSPVDGQSETAAPSGPVLRIRVRRGRDGSPVRDTLVRLWPLASLLDLASVGLGATTDQDGIVTFLDPPEAAVMVGLPQAESLRVIHAPRTETAIVDVVLPLGCAVRGQVVDANDRPAAGAVILGHGDHFEGARLGVTDDDGRFTLEDVAPGRAITAHLDGSRPSLAQSIPDRRDQVVELRLVLGDAVRVVCGVVREGGGMPSAGATVLAIAADGLTPDMRKPHRRADFVRCDRDGSFALRLDRTSAWTVVAAPRSRDHFTVTRIEVPASELDTVVEIALLRAASIEGRVRIVGEVSPESSIRAFLEQPDQDIGYLTNGLGLRSATIAADGSYRLGGLAPGTHRLTLTVGAHTLHDTRRIVEGAREFWDVDLLAGSKLTLHLRGAPPKAAGLVPIWVVRLYRLDAVGEREFVTAAQMTPAQSRAEFDSLAPGTYEVTLGVMGLGAMRDQVIDRWSAEVPAVADLHCDCDRLTLPTGSIRGRLLDAAGEPIAGRTLLAIRADGLGAWSETTRPDGTFRFEPLTSVTWRILLQGERRGDIGSAADLMDGEARDLGDLTLR